MFRRPVPCPNCSYDLRVQVGPEGAQCPECGERFQRNEIIASFRSPNQKWLRPSFLIATFLPALTIYLFSLLDRMSMNFDNFFLAWVLLSLICFLVLVLSPIIAIAYGAERQRYNPPSFQFLSGIGCLGLITLTNFVLLFFLLSYM